MFKFLEFVWALAEVSLATVLMACWVAAVVLLIMRAIQWMWTALF